ncbi:hypothetical protein PsYK624_057300 [Phanerochaete sordida]|uniref:Uncharacterized protein n=1 Tax=Phanerochaete sordida TaxID=48140 RepID=A0A9P3G7G0_9APHY|nr:hypothetical protein PsYK624_057300 [Phanerochaete sordida]
MPPFGIRALLRLTFRRKGRRSQASKSKHASQPEPIDPEPAFSDSDWEFASASSATLAAPPALDGAAMDEQGLYVCWAAFAGLPPRPLSPARALRLKQRIAGAVVAAGMGAAPPAQDPVDAALRAQGAVPRAPGSALYIGTFGQVEDAFDAAGLVTSVCDVEGFPEATRLGTMFVVRQKPAGAMQLVKLTLWA